MTAFNKALKARKTRVIIVSGIMFPVHDVTPFGMTLDMPVLLQEITGFSHISMTACGKGLVRLQAVYMSGLVVQLAQTMDDKSIGDMVSLALTVLIRSHIK